MSYSGLTMESPANMHIMGIEKQQLKFEDEHGALEKILFYVALCATMLTTTFLLPRIKVAFIFASKILNISFNVRGGIFQLYHIFGLFIGLFIALLATLIMQGEQFKKNIAMDSPEKKLYRLKFKWMIEEQIWLLALIVIELLSIFKFAKLYDGKQKFKSRLDEKETNRYEMLEKEENMATQASLDENN